MLVAASVVFLYYTLWVFVIVSSDLISPYSRGAANKSIQPFVDDDHVLHTLFPPRVWAIRIPVLLIILGSTVVGSFIGMVMVRSNRKKAAKAAAAKKKA